MKPPSKKAHSPCGASAPKHNTSPPLSAKIATGSSSRDLFDFIFGLLSSPKEDKDSIRLTGLIHELRDSIGWEPAYEGDFYQRIMSCGFNSMTIKPAFVLAQIVENLGPISVRGAFYRAVSAGIFRDTSDKFYRVTAGILLKLRRRGGLSYSKISDSTRRRLKPSSWSGLSDFMETVQNAYRKDLWSRQPEYIEVFVEKDAMAGVIEPITTDFDVVLNVIRGDASETFVWNIAEQWNRIQKPICAYYLGDHDPAGMRIEQTLRDKLGKLCRRDFRWKRLAITDEDFFSPDIAGFAIKGDRERKAWQTKHRSYLAKYADRCVEVDALSPEVIRGRVRGAIESHIEPGEWARLQAIEDEERQSVRQFVLAQKSAKAS